MRFAGSPGAIEAMGIYSGYNPGDISAQAALGRSNQRQNTAAAEAAILSNRYANEALIEKAEIMGQSQLDQVPGMGETMLQAGLQALPGAIGGMSFGGGAGATPQAGSLSPKVPGSYGNMPHSFGGLMK